MLNFHRKLLQILKKSQPKGRTFSSYPKVTLAQQPGGAPAPILGLDVGVVFDEEARNGQVPLVQAAGGPGIQGEKRTQVPARGP